MKLRSDLAAAALVGVSLLIAACSASPADEGAEEQMDGLISGQGRSYALGTPIRVCFEHTSRDTDWGDIDALNEAFKQAVSSEWGQKVGVNITGFRACSEMPDAMVHVRFFDCPEDGTGCPDGNKSPHVKFIGPPGKGEGPNYVNLRRTYSGHYREKECNGLKKVLWWTQREADETEARKRCTRNYGVHEFGHILGFDHEQYHPNTPQECDEKFHFPPTGAGAATWTCSKGYDDESVMNYCGKKFLNWDNGLSSKDVECAKEFFSSRAQPRKP